MVSWDSLTIADRSTPASVVIVLARVKDGKPEELQNHFRQPMASSRDARETTNR